MTAWLEKEERWRMVGLCILATLTYIYLYFTFGQYTAISDEGDYIRLARSLTEEIAGDEGKKSLVETMRELGDLIDVRIIAESVTGDDDFKTIREIGLFAASR